MQGIIVRSIVNSDLTTTPRQAMALAKQVQMASQNRSEIIVSFAGITTITAAFANRLFEQLYKLFGDGVNRHVKLDLASLASHQRELLELVVASGDRKLSQAEIDAEVD